MGRENRSQYALLGLLRRGPMSGYDLKRSIDCTIRHFWSESFGQIYPQLGRLVRDGHATVHEERGSGRRRKTYRITKSGRAALQRWLQAPTPPAQLRLEGLLKLFFADELDLRYAVRHLERGADDARRKLAAFEAIERDLLESCDAGSPRTLTSLLTLRYGQGLMRHDIDWAMASIAALDEKRREKK